MPLKVIVPKKCRECGYTFIQKSPIKDICLTCFLLKPEYQKFCKNLYPKAWEQFQAWLKEQELQEKQRPQLSEREKDELFKKWKKLVEENKDE